VTTLQVPLQLHGQTKGLPHHDARHGTIETVDTSDEDGSLLSFNSGGAVGALSVLLPRSDLPWACR
jgi:hypothetical protein